jgi:hypothetical protein
MRILTTIALILGAISLLLVGLVRVLRDLLERGPFEAPSIDDGVAWPRQPRCSIADVTPVQESVHNVAASDLQTP